MYGANTTETLEIQIKMDEYETTLGNMNQNP